MKNFKLVLFFGVAMILLLTFQAQAQEVVETGEKTGFFQNIWNNAKESGIWVIVMYVLGLLSKNGVTKVVKAIAGKTTIITKELSDVSLSVSNFSDLVDKAIKLDGSVDQNSLKEAAEAGKTVIVEAKEAWVTIKPKPVGTPAN